MAEGFIRQRGNAWQVIVHAGRDPLTGKRRNLTGTARTKREAQALPCPTAHPGRRGQTTSHRRDPRSVAQALAGDGRPRLEHPGYLQGLHRADHPADARPSATAASRHRHTRPLQLGVARPRRRRRQTDGAGHCARFTRSCAGGWIRRPAGAGFRPTQLPSPAHPDLGRPRSARPPQRRSPGSLRPPTRLIRISRSCCGWPRRRVLGGESCARCGGRMLTWRRPSS
jgi:hypothetical protein